MPPHREHDVDLVVEIAYCRDLLVADTLSSDPYVKVKMGGKYIHKTKYIVKDLNPVFTPKHDSFFYLSSKELSKHGDEGIILELFDHDTFGANDPLGTVHITAHALRMAVTTLQKAAGEFTIDVKPPPDRSDEVAGRVTIRSRSIDDFEEGFVKHLKHGKMSSTYPGVGRTKDKILKPGVSKEREPSKAHSPHGLSGAFLAVGAGTAKVFKRTARPVTHQSVISNDYSSEAADTRTVEIDVASDTGRSKGDDTSETTGTMVDNSEATGRDDTIDSDDFIIEIKSCEKLIAGHLAYSDPYVKVRVGKRYFHKTKHRHKTLNPVYTPKHDSLFYMSSRTLAKYEGTGGITFKVMDHDRVASDIEIGSVQITSSTLRNCRKKSVVRFDSRTEGFVFGLSPPPNKKRKDAGSINIRCRPVDDYEEAFQWHLKSGKGSSSFPGIGTSEEAILKRGPATGVTQVKQGMISATHKIGHGMISGTRHVGATTQDQARKGVATVTSSADALSQPLLHRPISPDHVAVEFKEPTEEVEGGEDDSIGSCFLKISRCCHKFTSLFAYHEVDS